MLGLSEQPRLFPFFFFGEPFLPQPSQGSSHGSSFVFCMSDTLHYCPYRKGSCCTGAIQTVKQIRAMPSDCNRESADFVKPEIPKIPVIHWWNRFGGCGASRIQYNIMEDRPRRTGRWALLRIGSRVLRAKINLPGFHQELNFVRLRALLRQGGHSESVKQGASPASVAA